MFVHEKDREYKTCLNMKNVSSLAQTKKQDKESNCFHKYAACFFLFSPLFCLSERKKGNMEHVCVRERKKGDT